MIAPKLKKKRYKLKEGKDVEKFKKELFSLQKMVQDHIEQEKLEIVSLVNPSLEKQGKTESERILYHLNRLRKKEKKLTFEEVASLFAQGKEEELLQRPGFTPEDLPIVQEKMYLQLLFISRFNLLSKKAVEKGAAHIGGELKRRRVFKFTESPEKLVRGKLLFEANLGVLLWDKPDKQLEKMLFSPHAQSVLELIMASGKSFYLIPAVSYFEANGSSLICNIWPSSVARNAIDFIANQAKKAYHQTANAFSCNRSINWSLSRLYGVYLVFKRTLVEGEQMNATKEDMQAFELSFLEQGLDISDKFKKEGASWKERLSYFMNVLGLIRKSGKANIDEPHIQFEPKKELNFPIGTPLQLKTDQIDLMREILILLVSIPEIQHLLPIKNKKPFPMDPQIFKKKVAPLLAEKISKLKELKIPIENQQQLTRYLLGMEKTIPAFVLNSSTRSLIGLAKGMVTVLLSHSLEKIIHVDFTASKKGNGEGARPSEGNDNPSETATIRNPFEAFIKSGILKLHEELSDEQTEKFIKLIIQKAKNNEHKNHIPFERTIYARFFKDLCPGYELSPDILLSEEATKIKEILKKNDRAIMTYVSWVIAPEIKYYRYNLKSDSHNFASMFDSFYSYDGSPNKEGCFPHKTHVHWDKGTIGESIDLLINTCSNKSSISILTKEAPEEVLEEILTLFKKDSTMRAIIDRGALLNGLSNEKVAKTSISYIEKDLKENLKGVIFYNADKEQAILEKGATKPMPLEESRIPKEKRITYFDECHTYAADVPQDENGGAIVTIGEHLTLEGLTQAIWRMRGLKNAKQHLTFVMTEKVKMLVSPNKEPTIEDIIKFAARNEERLIAEYNYASDRQKLQNVIRRAILDKVIFAENVDQALSLLQEFKDTLLTKVEDDPFFLYGFIDVNVEPQTLLDELRVTLFQVIENSPSFTQNEKSVIKNNLYEIGKGPYPEKVQAYKMGDKLDGDKLDDLGKGAEIEQSELSEQEQETNLHLEVDQNLQQFELPPKTNDKGPNFWPWPNHLSITNLGWLKVQPISNDSSVFGRMFQKSGAQMVPIFSLKEALHKALDPSIQAISGAIHPSILATNNFIQLLDKGILARSVDPYSKLQKPTFEALVIQEEKGGKKERLILLLDQKEAEYWRNKLKEDRDEAAIKNPEVKLALWDIVNHTIVSSSKNYFAESELGHPFFEKIRLQLQSLDGNVVYTEKEKKILTPWIRKNDPDKMKAAFRVIHEHHRMHPFEGSDLEDVFFNVKGIPLEHRIRV